MINKVLLFGNVGDKVFENATSTGKRMIAFSIKQVSEYNDRTTGQPKSSTAFYNVVMFNEDVRVNPGDNVLVEGRLSNSKDKNDKYVLGITAQKITVIHSNPGEHGKPIESTFQDDMPF